VRMTEIGSEFWTVPPEGGPGLRQLMPAGFDTVLTLSGRTALEMIIEDWLCGRKGGKVYLPSYCCHTMIEPFVRHGLRVQFYHVWADRGAIRCGYEDNDCDLVFLLDYFGFLRPETEAFACAERAKGKTVIYDATQSMFCEGVPYRSADYVFGSFRKWTGVNAGFAAKASPWNRMAALAQCERYTSLRNAAFDLKAGCMRAAAKERFLAWFRTAEEWLEGDYSHYAPDERSLAALDAVDPGRLRRRRRENAERLIRGLAAFSDRLSAVPALGPGECPLFVPIFVREKRDDLRQHLIRSRVYLPVHWPLSGAHDAIGEAARGIYQTEMSCVCDQRYGPEDMDTILEDIGSFYHP